LTEACVGNTFVFTHDPVLTFLIAQAAGRVSSPYEPSDTTELLIHKKDCVLVVATYRGILPPKLYAAFNSPLSSERFRESQTLNLGYDRFHMIKTWISNEPFPDYYLTIKVHEALQDLPLPDWYHLTVSQ
jgi:hypothetical protein